MTGSPGFFSKPTMRAARMPSPITGSFTTTSRVPTFSPTGAGAALRFPPFSGFAGLAARASGPLMAGETSALPDRGTAGGAPRGLRRPVITRRIASTTRFASGSAAYS